MSLYPNGFQKQDRLGLGARGELFNTNIPGYNPDDERINRTNNKLNIADHDVLNVKYGFDDRLPVLFRYGYAVGYNQIVIPKGRIVAVDPNLNKVDFGSGKEFNTLTLANGGVPVRLRQTGDKYVTGKNVSTEANDVHGVGKEWIPVAGYANTYADGLYKPFATATPKEQLTAANLTVDETTGLVKDQSGNFTSVRPANIPLGMISRNEYTRDEDAFNGIMPGPIHTDAVVELPWFLYKDKAETSPWGSVYGGLFPGAQVKADENGRVTVSPLSFPEVVAAMSVGEYEAERQQVIGTIVSTSQDLLPEGAAKYAQWALSDIKNFEDFNPEEWYQTNRRGEDAITNSPHKLGPNGYPYDPAYTNHDLHMLESHMNTYDQRMELEHRYDLGIPGLTDGYNAVVTPVEDEKVGYFGAPVNGGIIDTTVPYIDIYLRTRQVNVEEGSLQVKVGNEAYVPATVGAKLSLHIESTTYEFLKVKYADAKQGIVVLEVFDREKADAYFGAEGVNAKVPVSLKYNKRGMAGVPTFMDWDGCIGSAKILLQK